MNLKTIENTILEPWELDSCPITGLSISRKPGWTNVTFGSDYYRITYSAIGNNIILSKTWGSSTLDTTKKYMSLLEKIVDEILPDGEKYILLEDYTDHTNASFSAKNYYIQYQKNNKRIKGLIFINTSTLFQIMIKIGKRLGQPEGPVELVPDYQTAILLAQEYLECLRRRGSWDEVITQPDIEKLGKKIILFGKNTDIVRDVNEMNRPGEIPGAGMPGKNLSIINVREDIDSVLQFLGKINWDSDGMNVDKVKVGNAELMGPLIESISLIKKDFDAIIKKKNDAEDVIIEQNKFNELRAEIWKLAADKSLDEQELIQELLDRVGAVTGVSRACYNVFTGAEHHKSDMKNIIEWCKKGVKPSLGFVMPSIAVRYFIKDKPFVVTRKTVLEKLSEPVRYVIAPIVSRIEKSLNLKSVLICPYFVKGSIEGLLSFDICNDNEEKTTWKDYEKNVILDVANIISGKITQARAEKEVRDSEEWFRILFEYAPDGYYLNDLKGTFIAGNKMAEKITGYNKEELIGKSFLKLKLLPPSQIKKAGILLAKNALGKPTGPDEFILNKKGGESINVEIRTFPIVLKKRPLILGIARDISERKDSYEKEKKYVRNLEYLSKTALDFVAFSIEDDIYEYIAVCLEAVFKNAIILVSSYEEDTGRLLFRSVAGLGKLSKAAFKLLGRSPVGMSFKILEEHDQKLRRGELIEIGNDIYEPAGRQIPKKACRAIEKLVALKQIYSLGIAREGRMFAHVSVLAREEVGTEGKAVLKTFANQASITFQKRKAEEELRRSEKSLEEAQSIAHVGNWSWNIVTRKFSWSEEVYRIFDLNPEEVKPSYEGFLDVIHPEDRDSVKRALNDALFDKKFSIDHRVILPDGRERTVHEMAEIRNDKSGKPLLVVGTIQDISARKKAENEKEELHKQLIQSEKLSAIGQLAGGVAHEINNPLSSVILLSQLNQKKLSPDTQEYNDLKSIESAGLRCKKIVQSLLTYSRMDECSFSTISINDVIETTFDLVGYQLKVNKIKVEKKLEKQLPEISGNSQQLEQVFINLITNSMDEMPDGGVLEVETRIARADTDDGRSSSRVVEVVFTDTGKGISKENINNLFDPFFTTKVVGKGTGLGLSISKGIIEGHKGHIKIESEPGKGAKFIIILPIRGGGNE